MTDIKKNDSEWLKACTLHIRGIPWEDRAGIGLRSKLSNYLDDKGGRVLGI